jgi:hypothetical protein
MAARYRRLYNPAALQTGGLAPPARVASGESTDHDPSGSPSKDEPEAHTDGPAGPQYTTRAEVEGLGVSLGPALHDACGDRLGDIEWFQSPWQRSGAATGFTTWRLPDGEVIDAIAKVPVSYTEYFWTTRLGEVDPMWWYSELCRHLPVARVLASGTELGGYDVAWIVIERVSGGTISSDMTPDNLERLFAAAAAFHQRAAGERNPADGDVRRMPDWAVLLDKAAAGVRDNGLDHADRWLRAIDGTRGVLPRLVETWAGRIMDTWCHGDLHPGNAIIRCDRTCPEDRCGVLIDLALVHPGHWVEDALYLERMYWGREEQLGGVVPIEALARHRLALGLHADEKDEELADVRRVLMGATSPAFLSQERSPVYLGAAVDRVERGLHLFGWS